MDRTFAYFFMENMNGLDIAEKLKHVIAENRSLTARLDEYASIVDARNAEIEILNSMVSDGKEQRSQLDNDLWELQSLQEYMRQLKKISAKVESGSFHLGNNDSKNTLVSAMKEQQALLQVKLSEMEIELRELSSRNMLLQQQNSRLGELESLLEIAERERDAYKLAANKK
jgi:hypothetical protein